MGFVCVDSVKKWMSVWVSGFSEEVEGELSEGESGAMCRWIQ